MKKIYIFIVIIIFLGAFILLFGRPQLNETREFLIEFENGQLAINGEPASKKLLSDKLCSYLESYLDMEESPKIIISGNETEKLQNMVDILKIVCNHGPNQVYFKTIKAKESIPIYLPPYSVEFPALFIELNTTGHSDLTRKRLYHIRDSDNNTSIFATDVLELKNALKSICNGNVKYKTICIDQKNLLENKIEIEMKYKALYDLIRTANNALGKNKDSYVLLYFGEKDKPSKNSTPATLGR